MTNTIRRKRFSFRRGITSVEFALTVPILFAFFFASLEFSRANMIRHTAQNAAYEGARAAIVPGATADKAVAVAQATLAVVGIQDGSIRITPAVLGTNDAEVTVRVSVPVNTNSYITPLFLAGQTLDASCTLTRERTGL